jgi:hypothetical protein
LSPNGLVESGLIQAFKYLNHDELANEWERWKGSPPRPQKVTFYDEFQKGV